MSSTHISGAVALCCRQPHEFLAAAPGPSMRSRVHVIVICPLPNVAAAAPTIAVHFTVARRALRIDWGGCMDHQKINPLSSASACRGTRATYNHAVVFIRQRCPCTPLISSSSLAMPPVHANQHHFAHLHCGCGAVVSWSTIVTKQSRCLAPAGSPGLMPARPRTP